MKMFKVLDPSYERDQFIYDFTKDKAILMFIIDALAFL